MESLEFRLRYEALSQQVYYALATEAGLKEWWTRHCRVDDAVGGEADFRFPDADFFAVMQILALEPYRRVEWLCVDAHHPEASGWRDLEDWVGTRIEFTVTDLKRGWSELHFRHIGLAPSLESYDTCKSAWYFYLNESLRAYVELGEGQPFVGGATIAETVEAGEAAGEEELAE